MSNTAPNAEAGRPVDPVELDRAFFAWMKDELVFDLEPVRVAGDGAMPVFARPMSRADRLIDAFEARWQAETGRGLTRTGRALVFGYLGIAAGDRSWRPTMAAGGAVGRAELWVSACLRSDGGSGEPVVIDSGPGVDPAIGFDASEHLAAAEAAVGGSSDGAAGGASEPAGAGA